MTSPDHGRMVQGIDWLAALVQDIHACVETEDWDRALNDLIELREPITSLKGIFRGRLSRVRVEDRAVRLGTGIATNRQDI